MMAVMPQRSKKISLQISAPNFLIWEKKKKQNKTKLYYKGSSRAFFLQSKEK